ncbi:MULTISPECIES: CinA family protein [Rhodomicrobium]|uniref:CinA family protein n=1 Tax=Rhodomicrobium TaxID=1068 RepID=UPI000B4B0098|nr:MULTISPECIES: CinA family protein [Rhodomicrobium]
MREKLVMQAQAVLDFCRANDFTIAAAESCTGGLVAAYLTHIAGASDIFERGFVTYSNDAKIELLGVDAQMIAEFGAVSRQVALAMAAGALWRSKASLAVSVTGIAGPGGGSADKPVGLVHFAIAKRVSVSREQLDFRALHHEENFGDIGRAEVREESVATAFRMLLQAASL